MAHLPTPMKWTALALALALSAGCSSMHNSMQRSGIGEVQLQALDRSQYEIVGDVEGEGKASYFLIFRISGPQRTSSLYDSNFFAGWGGISLDAAGIAQFDAIQSVAGADSLIAPRYEVETSGIPLLFWTQKVKVYAKAIRLKANKAGKAPEKQFR